MPRTTALSAALLIGTRAVLATLFTDGLFRTMAGAVVYGVDLTTPVMSQRKTVNGLKHADTANFRAGSFALSTIKRAPQGQLADVVIGDKPLTVIADLPAADRLEMLNTIIVAYDLEAVAKAA